LDLLERKTQQIALKLPREIRRKQERASNPFFNHSGGGGSHHRSSSTGPLGTTTGIGGGVTLANNSKFSGILQNLNFNFTYLRIQARTFDEEVAANEKKQIWCSALIFFFLPLSFYLLNLKNP